MYYLGLDLGAASCQAVLLNEQGEVVQKASAMHHNGVRPCMRAMLAQLPLDDDQPVQVAACGTMSHLLALPTACYKSETLALCTGAEKFYPQAGSYMAIGAQKTLYVVPKAGKEPLIRKNSNCSSGTGSFFEEQAGRLQIPLEKISETIQLGKTVPHIAGRCSVFSKTDMIHHMQEGVTTPDILLGLCYALVRNYKANILQNQAVKTPVLLCGGVMKNAGVLRAIEELLQLSRQDLLLDDYADYIPALGCALLAKEPMTKAALLAQLDCSLEVTTDTALKPLYPFAKAEDTFDFQTAPMSAGDTYLGIDIGSTSINLVLLGAEKQVLYYSYVKNIGKPLDIVQAEIAKLRTILPPDTEIARTAVTGSGREWIGKQLKAELVINEITAQTEGAALFHPETDTIFEIGGQDSKYMSLTNGKMSDFEMNKVCAAGTGAFLEEQIKKLGISMVDFLRLAMESEHPCVLGDRCTVFIESSITRALAEGHSMADVCAGLAYAIASNYLHRVVNQKPIGEQIAIQGGIAYNEAVICAFRALTGKKIHVSPYFSVTGALGAASLCTNHNYLTFDKEKNQRLNQKLLEESEQSYLGDYQPARQSGRPVIGIPRVIFLHKMFPLFQKMFTTLGFDVLLSPLSNEEIVALAQQYTMEETCYPIKLIHGHIAWLLEHNVQYILLPRLYTVRHKGSVARKDYSCMYMQTSPLIMEQTFHFAQRGVKLLMPELSLNFGKKYMIDSILSLAPQLGKLKPQMVPATILGVKALVEHSDRLETLAKDYFDTDEPVFVLVSRVYNIIDPVLNMGIEAHLNKLGCRVVHLEHLEASFMHVESEYSNLFWPFGQHILTGMKIIREHENLYPIYITNHGCGPDTAIQHYIQRSLEGREYLHLEVDEHSSPVGIITRLEAFLYSLKQKGRSAAAPQQWQVQPDAGAPVALVPDVGLYTPLLEASVPAGSIVRRAEPLKQHVSFNYAINKEYYSLLVMLEELFAACRPGERYTLYLPTDEGSEVFGQYGRLMVQELSRQGYPTQLQAPFVEDFAGQTDYQLQYRRMIALELYALLGQSPHDWAEISEEGLLALAQEAAAVLAADQRKPVMVIGEPLCIYKPAIAQTNLAPLQQDCRVVAMPLSEGLLFHLTDVDRSGTYAAQLTAMGRLHQQLTQLLPLYTPLAQLQVAAKGKLDFMLGNLSRYRFAKLLSLQPEQWRGAVLLNSAEENSAIVLKTLTEAYRDQISVPLCRVDADFEHRLSQEDAATFLYYL